MKYQNKTKNSTAKSIFRKILCLNTKKEFHKLAFWSMVENNFENNTIRCKKLTTTVSGQKNVAQSFVRQKQVSTSVEIKQQCCCYISALVLFCFRLTMGRATFFWPETIVVSFLHLMPENCNYFTDSRALRRTMNFLGYSEN